MIINSDRKNLNRVENNYHKFAHKLYGRTCAWHELEDQTFCGPSTNMQVQSHNGLAHETDD